MENRNAWDQFCQSGKIIDYLAYVKACNQLTAQAENEVTSNAGIGTGGSDQGLFPR